MCYLPITSVCWGNLSRVLDTFLPSLLGLFPVQAGALLKGKFCFHISLPQAYSLHTRL